MWFYVSNALQPLHILVIQLGLLVKGDNMNYSKEDRLKIWNLEEARKYILHDVFLVLYFILGLIGNLIVLIVYKTNRKQVLYTSISMC